MSDDAKPVMGTIGWTDLTVPNAEEVRDFYAEVVGWKPEPVDMGGYSDFTMLSPDNGAAVSGVCHARGGNADLPAQWLIYVYVADLDARLERCRALGGKVLAGPKSMGKSRYAIIRDPAGAAMGLYQQG